MSSRTPNISSLTGDYDAIERAIRETSRGRWFLNCYLERNRSAETRMLLDAIARLEGAMRDNGHVVEALQPAEALGKVAACLSEARGDIARMVSSDTVTVTLPVPRFSFGSIPRSTMAATQAIREAAATIEKAAAALRGAGVFQGVARQITDKTDEIGRACALQEHAVEQMHCLTALISEVEAEVLAAMEGRSGQDSPMIDAALTTLAGDIAEVRLAIPDGVMHELSLALSERVQTAETAEERDCSSEA
jgi:hypothetical protein